MAINWMDLFLLRWNNPFTQPQHSTNGHAILFIIAGKIMAEILLIKIRTNFVEMNYLSGIIVRLVPLVGLFIISLPCTSMKIASNKTFPWILQLRNEFSIHFHTIELWNAALWVITIQFELWLQRIAFLNGIMQICMNTTNWFPSMSAH